MAGVDLKITWSEIAAGVCGVRLFKKHTEAASCLWIGSNMAVMTLERSHRPSRMEEENTQLGPPWSL